MTDEQHRLTEEDLARGILTPTPTGSDPVSRAVGQDLRRIRRRAETDRSEAKRYAELSGGLFNAAAMGDAEADELERFLDERIPGRVRDGDAL